MSAQVISFHCVLKNQLGRVLGSTFNHEVITAVEGADGQQPEMLRGLVEGLRGLQKGEKRKIALSAKDAYGFYDPSKVMVRDRQALEERARGSRLKNGRRLRSGDEVMAQTRSGEFQNFRVVQAEAELVTLDGNHPLAGQDLIFEIEAVAVRPATLEEISDSAITTTSALH